MCEDPRVEESTLTVADTPAMRQVLARWLAHPDDVAPEAYVARGNAGLCQKRSPPGSRSAPAPPTVTIRHALPRVSTAASSRSCRSMSSVEENLIAVKQAYTEANARFADYPLSSDDPDH